MIRLHAPMTDSQITWLELIFIAGILQLLIFAGTTLRPHKAAAATTSTYCGVLTGNAESLAGVIVESVWRDYSGGMHDANNTGVVMTDIDGRSDDDPGNFVVSSYNTSVGNHDSGVRSGGPLTFSQNGTGCNGTTSGHAGYYNYYGGATSGSIDGHNVVLGYSHWPGYTDPANSTSNVGHTNWTLDCDQSQYGLGNERQFKITGSGTPSGATYGGSWSTVTLRAKNGYTAVIQLVFTENPPPNWALSGSTSPSASAVFAGATLTFANTITNDNEGGTASFNYGPRHFYSSTDQSGITSIPSNETTSPTYSTSLGPGASTPNGAADESVTVSSGYNWICGTVGFSPSNSRGGTNGRSPAKCVAIRQAECGALSYSPSMLEPGLPFTITGLVSYNNVSDKANAITKYGGKFYIKVTNSAGTSYYSDTDVADSNASTSSIFKGISSAVTVPLAGDYTVTWGVDASVVGASASCSKTLSVKYHPYFSVLGGDITAGQGYGAACTDATADIQAWNTNTSGYSGAGSETAAMATGTITNFVSGLGLATGVSTGYKLSFANTGSGVNITNPNYGGKFGTIPCATNYYAGATGTNSLPSFGSTSGTYSVTGTKTLAASVLNGGTNITLYVKGNVYITGNIKYGSYNLNTVPRFNLYVQGNIYIGPNVTELHGVYVAQKASPTSTTTGIISTCASSGSETAAPYATCNKPLLIVGGISAEGQLQLMRTCASLVGNAPCNNGSSPLVTPRPAETFQYSPELWLNAPANTDLQLKSYTSLPPVL